MVMKKKLEPISEEENELHVDVPPAAAPPAPTPKKKPAPKKKVTPVTESSAYNWRNHMGRP